VFDLADLDGKVLTISVGQGYNVERLDPACELPGLVLNEPTRLAPRPGAAASVRRVLNMSFGMLGINSAVVVQSPTP
jgi:3-oxoacyl-[acyl-carrier-protein] synthase II